MIIGNLSLADNGQYEGLSNVHDLKDVCGSRQSSLSLVHTFQKNHCFIIFFKFGMVKKIQAFELP